MSLSGNLGFDVAFDNSLAEVNGSFSVESVKFAFFAHVYQLSGLAGGSQTLVLFDVNFVDSLFGIFYDRQKAGAVVFDRGAHKSAPARIVFCTR